MPNGLARITLNSVICVPGPVQDRCLIQSSAPRGAAFTLPRSFFICDCLQGGNSSSTSLNQFHCPTTTTVKWSEFPLLQLGTTAFCYFIVHPQEVWLVYTSGASLLALSPILLP